MKTDYSHLKNHPLIGVETNAPKKMFNYDKEAPVKKQITAQEFLAKYQHRNSAPCFYTVASDVVQVEAETGQSFKKVSGEDMQILIMKNRTGTFFDDGVSITLMIGPCG